MHMSSIQTKPTRLWFLGQGYTPIDPTLVFGRIFYIRVKDQEVSILDAFGQKGYIQIRPNEKGRANFDNVNPYYYLNFSANGRTRQVPIAFLVMATLNHQIPDRSKGEVIDHIDGNSLNNNPRNLRVVHDAINRRDGGFLRKLRNNNIDVKKFPGMILEGFERMAEWKATHTRSQYDNLKHEKLLRVFVGPTFTVVDPLILNDLELTKHYDPFVERS